MEKVDLEIVFQRYIDNAYTEADLNALLEAIAKDKLDGVLTSKVLEKLTRDNENVDEELVEHIAMRVDQKLEGILLPTKVKRFTWLPYAAAILLFLGIGLYFYSIRTDDTIVKTEIVSTGNVAPGSNKAVLRINGGEVIALDEEKGQIITKEGAVVYADGAAVAAGKSEVAQYVLSTPRAGQYQAVLPDGTKVWLNAASSISFPQQFSSSERIVSIAGEVYFEVAHEPNRPFKVKMNGQLITVKGTTFNVNAYEDASERTSYTTLITGKVEVLTDKGRVLQLIPGQELTNDGVSQMVKVANTEMAIAWKNGYFLFDKEPLKNVMQQLSRWYDVRVEYTAGQQLEEVYGGSISRSITLREALDILETIGDVGFAIQGNKVIVYKKTN